MADEATVAAIMALAYRCTHESSTAEDIDALAASIRAALVSAEQGARERALEDAATVCKNKAFAARKVQSDSNGNVAAEQSNVHLRMMAMYAEDCAEAVRALKKEQR